MTSTFFARHRDDDPVAIGVTPTPARTARRAVRALSADLAARGARRVLVACEDRLAFAIAFAASVEAGAIAILPDASTIRDPLSLPTGTFDVLLHDREGAAGTDVRPFLDRDEGDAPRLASLEVDRIVAEVFTSGTTGVPVTHPKTGRSLTLELDAIDRWLRLDVPRVACGVPPHHLYGLLYTVLVPATRGGFFDRGTALHAPTIEARVAELGANLLVTVPGQLRALVEGGANIDATVVSSGAQLPHSTHERALRTMKRVIDVLGSTETGGIAYSEAPGGRFSPFPGVRVGVSEAGLMRLDSRHASLEGYETTDRIRPRADGSFEHLGRADSVVKVAGVRVDLRDVETAASELSAVRAARAIALPGSGVRGTAIGLAVEATSLDEATVRAHLERRLARVLVPRRIVVVDAFPRDAMGKTSAATLRALFGWSRTGTMRRAIGATSFDVVVPEGHSDFEGHFHDMPIFPAVSQLERVVLPSIAELIGARPRLVGLRNLKFRAPIVPGDRLRLELAPASDRCVFSLSREGVEVSGGTLLFDRPIEPPIPTTVDR